MIPALISSVPSLVTNDWLQQIIPKLSRVPIAQELSEANAQQGLIVVRLHHSVQHQQQRVTDRCLFCNLSRPPCSVSGIQNRFIQSTENVRSKFPRTRNLQGLRLNCLKIKRSFRQILIPLVSERDSRTKQLMTHSYNQHTYIVLIQSYWRVTSIHRL